jgi:DNA-binding transcriptional LysR family regulator
MQDELVLITSPAHAFAAKGRVHIKDLAEESLLVMDVSEPSPWHRKIADAFEQVKAALHLAVENAPIEMIKKLVAAGVGVGFVPLMSVQEERQNGELAVIEVDGLHLERSVWLVRRRAVQSPAAKAFLQTAVAFGEQLRGRAPAIMPKAARCSSPSLLKREEVLLVKRQI